MLSILDVIRDCAGPNFSVITQNYIMNRDKDKQQGTDTKPATQQQGQEPQQNVHFDHVSETYGSDETKEALTERD